MCKISILMPAYNAERYISNAIDSVVNQSFEDWELIIIDDCSTDSTGKISDKYSLADSRIKVYHMLSNIGISKAKNEALNRAKGDYVAFCDDDDVMDKDSLLNNMSLVEKYNPQVVRWSYKTIKVDEDERIYSVVDCKCEKGIYLSANQIFRNYNNVHTMLSCDWTALYKKEILDANNIRFDERFRYGGEDTLFNIELLNYVDKMIMNDECYYSWYLRKKHSTTAKRDVNFCYSMIEVAKRERDIIFKYCDDADTIWHRYREFYEKLIIDYAAKLPEFENQRINEIIFSIRNGTIW